MSAINSLSMLPEDKTKSQRDTEGSLKRVDAIRVGVLKALGKPAKLYRVAVVPLWSNNYRVNVVTGEDPTSVQIPNSYFIKADGSGTILESTPPIRKQY